MTVDEMITELGEHIKGVQLLSSEAQAIIDHLRAPSNNADLVQRLNMVDQYEIAHIGKDLWQEIIAALSSTPEREEDGECKHCGGKGCVACSSEHIVTSNTGLALVEVVQDHLQYIKSAGKSLTLSPTTEKYLEQCAAVIERLIEELDQRDRIIESNTGRINQLHQKLGPEQPYTPVLTDGWYFVEGFSCPIHWHKEANCWEEPRSVKPHIGVESLTIKTNPATGQPWKIDQPGGV